MVLHDILPNFVRWACLFGLRMNHYVLFPCAARFTRTCKSGLLISYSDPSAHCRCSWLTNLQRFALSQCNLRAVKPLDIVFNSRSRFRSATRNLPRSATAFARSWTNSKRNWRKGRMRATRLISQCRPMPHQWQCEPHVDCW